MTDILIFFRQMWSILIGLLDLYTFEIGGIEFSIFEILLGLVLSSMAITIFWKGARG